MKEALGFFAMCLATVAVVMIVETLFGATKDEDDGPDTPPPPPSGA